VKSVICTDTARRPGFNGGRDALDGGGAESLELSTGSLELMATRKPRGLMALAVWNTAPWERCAPVIGQFDIARMQQRAERHIARGKTTLPLDSSPGGHQIVVMLRGNSGTSTRERPGFCQVSRAGVRRD